MITKDYHVHTNFSDGKNTAEEMVRSAITLGMTEIGFSDHSALSMEQDWAMKKEEYTAYRREIARLKDAYKGQINILCGIERDIDSDEWEERFDYVIGSVHMLRKKGVWFGVDHSADVFRNAVEELYDGDPYALCEDYYEKMLALGDMNPDIIGHFDLVTKFNEGYAIFDEENPRYLAARNKALDALIKLNKPFEINTGAISRGYRKSPYPSESARDYIRARGGKFILSSDSHRTDTIMYRFREYEHLL